MAAISETGKILRRGLGITPEAAAATVDVATLFGVLGAFMVIGAAMVLGGSPGSFVDLPAILIVVGGTFLVTTVSFTLAEVVHAQRVMLRAVVYHAESPRNAALSILHLADIARKKGPLVLEEELSASHQSRFLAQAISLVIDTARRSAAPVPEGSTGRVLARRPAGPTIFRYQTPTIRGYRAP